MKVIAAILVAGKSTRFDSKVSKQVFLLKNKPVFTYPLNTFNNNKLIDEILLVSDKEHQNELENYVEKNKMNKVHVITGGETRQKSVENALDAIKTYSEDDLLIIHDGARPLINDKIINSTIEAAKNHGAVTTYIKVEDTLALSENEDHIAKFIDRKDAIRIQTPQGFKLGIIRKAHLNATTTAATDDCSLVMALPMEVKLIPGSKELTKLTTIEDVNYLETLIK